MHLNASDYQSLESSTLFRSVQIGTLASQLATCKVMHVLRGDTLLRPDRENSHIFIVLDGELKVQLHGQQDTPQARLTAGDCVGEMSLVDGQAVSAWVLAETDARLLAVPHTLLWSLVESSHLIARNLLAILSGRVRTNNLTLVAAQTRSLEFEEAASVDVLTGLHNRRWLQTVMPRVLQRCDRDGQPVVMMLADVDRFIQYAEKVGPLVSDNALRRVATALADGLRAQDLIARWHNDRFIIVFTRTEIDESLFIADRLRDHVAILCLASPVDDQILTLSCGLALHRTGERLDDLIKRAEVGLERAKANGRDCAEVES